MKATITLGLKFTAILAILLTVGCASPNVNPASPRAGAGYVDLYLDSGDRLAWDVRRFDTAANQFKVVFSELDPPEGRILRLAFAPGCCRIQVTFLNRPVTEPALFEVEVQTGRITPVGVTLAEAGAASVLSKETSFGSTVRGGYGRRTKGGSYESSVYRVLAVPQKPQPYQIKEMMPYAQQSTK